jgi:hypothetical protein
MAGKGRVGPVKNGRVIPCNSGGPTLYTRVFLCIISIVLYLTYIIISRNAYDIAVLFLHITGKNNSYYYELIHFVANFIVEFNIEFNIASIFPLVINCCIGWMFVPSLPLCCSTLFDHGPTLPDHGPTLPTSGESWANILNILFCLFLLQLYSHWKLSSTYK